MSIRMAGIDYEKAPVEVRERFSMTKAAAASSAAALCRDGGISGCVILSTCNRTELWINGKDEGAQPYDLLCREKGADPALYRGCFSFRQDEEAALYLFELACGMRSQVYGEDQIITQVGEALAVSRQAGGTDAVLETLFRMAVTAAKEVKTKTRLAPMESSVATRTVEFLKKKFKTLSGVPCLVIGNGNIGRLAAQGLRSEGAEVMVTLRSHHHGGTDVPQGCAPVPYDGRLSVLPDMKIVVSATASPHYTLRAGELPRMAHPVCFCDLAVPRDIDPEIGEMENAELYHTDTICGPSGARRDPEQERLAEKILHTHLDEFFHWYRFRSLVPEVNKISGLAAEDMLSRVGKSIDRLDLEAEERKKLAESVGGAAEKVVARLVYGLREHLDPALWESCIAGLKKAAEMGTHTK